MAQSRPRNRQQLQDYLRQEWEKIFTDTLSRLVSSMPKRLAAVIRRKADVTSCFSWTAIYPHVLAVRGDPLHGWYILVPGASIGRYPSHLAGLLKGIKRQGSTSGVLR
ncbi:hypothetical protein AVEN_128072-1 [Araneus ventricosus]|uniref:Uncharacterized protein n=1 Tax=Araneus ventricosus TaxID=182803 RepID=A0A4Y2A002_ARAVE|nr:hypothetical protein AVEN_128072-1 [Araneus ventricosus]